MKIYIRHKVHLSPWRKLSNLALVKLFIAMHNVINRSLPATILILEYSFFLSQQSTQESANTLELAAAEYGKSGTSAAVQKAVEDVLSQDHADDKEFWKIILDITLQNRMCGWHLFWRRANFILIASLLAKVAKEWEVQKVVERTWFSFVKLFVTARLTALRLYRDCILYNVSIFLGIVSPVRGKILLCMCIVYVVPDALVGIIDL